MVAGQEGLRQGAHPDEAKRLVERCKCEDKPYMCSVDMSKENCMNLRVLISGLAKQRLSFLFSLALLVPQAYSQADESLDLMDRTSFQFNDSDIISGWNENLTTRAALRMITTNPLAEGLLGRKRLEKRPSWQTGRTG